MKTKRFYLTFIITFIAIVALSAFNVYATADRHIFDDRIKDSDNQLASSISSAYQLSNATPSPTPKTSLKTTPAPTPAPGTGAVAGAGAGPVAGAAAAGSSSAAAAATATPTASPSASPSSKSSHTHDGHNNIYDDSNANDYYMRYLQAAAATASPTPTPTPVATAGAASTASPTAPAMPAAPAAPITPAGATPPSTPAPAAPNTTPGIDSASDAQASATSEKGLSNEQILARLIKRIESDIPEVEKKTDETATAKVAGDSAADLKPVETADDKKVADPAPDNSELAGPAPGQSEIIPPTLISVTNPKIDENEIVYKNTYSICGVRDDDADPEEPIIIFFTRYDTTTESYIEYADIDGEAQWTVGANGVFTRSVQLEEGENKFAIAACAASIIEAAQTEGRAIEDNEIQVVKFTIVYRAQNVAEKISEIFKGLTIANILKEIENH